MRILLWAPFGAGEHYWGPGQSAFNLYSKLNNKDVKISVAHGYVDKKKYDLYEEQYFISKLEKNNKTSLIRFLYNSKKWIKNNSKKFDIAHVLTDHHPSFLSALWLQDAGVYTFIKIAGAGGNLVHNSLASKLLGLYSYMGRRKNDVSGYIVISNRIKQELIDLGVAKNKIHFIPNGVDVNRFCPVSDIEKKELRKKLGVKDIFTVLFTGGITSRKRPSLIVEAFRHFKNDSSIQLLIIGPDRISEDESHRINEIVKQYSLETVIRLQFKKNIEDYYKISDIFVLPSKNEGLSNSLLEAQSSGLPAIVTKISGSEDLITDNENGFFIDSEPDPIYRSIKKYYLNPDLLKKHSDAARNIIREKYDSDIIIKKHIELFKNTVLR